MNFGQAVRSCFGQYVGFSGRARRSEYWWFTLFNVIVVLVIDLIDAALKTPILGILALGSCSRPSPSASAACMTPAVPRGGC